MYRKLTGLLFVVAMLAPRYAWAVTEEDFKVKSTRNLLNLCTVSAEDPQYKEAIHFCHGYLVGAYAYYVAEQSGEGSKPLVCLPDPPPSRNAAIAMFIDWARAHQQYMDERPVDTEFRFLAENWPCKR